MNDKIGSLSPQQRQILKEFREDVADILKPTHDDYFLLRWLKARHFDMKKASTMIRKSMIWRRQIGADTLLTSYQIPEVVEKYVPTAFLGFDKEGSAVRLLPQGPLDYKGLVASVRKLELIKSLASVYEYDLDQIKQNNEKIGKKSETFVFILDYDGFSLKQVASKAVMDMIFELLRVFESNYPERLKIGFVINAPPLFSTLFSAVKPLLADETRKKFQFFGKNGWKNALLEVIDPEVLPVGLGGKRIDDSNNIQCPLLMPKGGSIPESYYLKNQIHPRLSEYAEAVKVTVDSKSVYPVEIHVPDSHSIIEWEIETDSDIGLGLLYLSKSCTGKIMQMYPVEEIFPTEKLYCHMGTEIGTFYCEKAGFYILQIDNSYSKFRQKVVTYRVKVISQRNGEVVPPNINLQRLSI